MELIINTKWLHALRRLAPTKDIRTYLNGVLVDAENPRRPKLVEGSGAALGVLDVRTCEADEAFQVSIPQDTLKLLPKATDVVLRKVAGERWEIGNLGFAAVPGKYPQWRHPLPAKCSGEAAHFDPRLLATFLDVAHGLGAPFLLAQNGTSGALVSVPSCPEFIGVLMPYRSADAALVSATPGWAK